MQMKVLLWQSVSAKEKLYYRPPPLSRWFFFFYKRSCLNHSFYYGIHTRLSFLFLAIPFFIFLYRVWFWTNFYSHAAEHCSPFCWKRSRWVSVNRILLLWGRQFSINQKIEKQKMKKQNKTEKQRKFLRFSLIHPIHLIFSCLYWIYSFSNLA